MSPDTNSESPEKRSFRRVVSILAFLVAAFMAGVLLIGGTSDVAQRNPALVQVARDHFAAIVGLPAAAFTSFFVVLALEVKTGRVEFEAWD